jgi:SAC3/GANP family
MVRKDFILQNYVGTGGKCDARAVRCHERIARWHTMCEHQLSHIPEFVTKQSQQNIQELGQTMKTLNQYYDDSLNRSTVEVPDEYGKETRLDLSNYNHGCVNSTVQGPNPIDFNSAPLLNDANSGNIKRRLIGSVEGINGPHHGTAEPEMRGLYILLTLENDGGMEVLKYAARLFQCRPAVYHSIPVQLALNIYKVGIHVLDKYSLLKSYC